MEALRFTFQTRLLELAKMPVPCLTDPLKVLIKIAYAGICGTDLQILEGKFPCSSCFTPGHEVSGTVMEVGCNVKTLKEGDLVAVDPNSSCKCCHFCRSGKPNFCQFGGINTAIGIAQDGGWASHAVIPEEQVHKLPKNVNLEQAALAEPVSCLAHAWDITSPINVGAKILVLGAGIAGHLLLCMLHFQGHKTVTVSEPNCARLAFLQNLNSCYELLTPEQLITKQANNRRYLFDLVFDCSGSTAAVEHAFTMLNFGGKLCIYGVAMPEDCIKISPYQMFRKELTIVGANVNPYSFPKSFALLQALGERYLSYDHLGISTFKLEDYKDAIECLKTGAIAKAVFKI